MKKLASFLLVAVTMLPGIVSADTFTRFLTVGSRGSDVMQLQIILRAGDYLSVEPTGYFGKLTRLAVMAYQKKNNLEQVGSVGPKTRGLLNASLMTPQITPPPPSAPVTPQAENVSTQTTSTPTTTAPAVNPPSSTNEAPKVTLVSPKTIVPRTSFQIDFIVNTDKPALCRYDTVPNREFRFMKSYAITGETTHTTILTSFAVDGLYIYYVRCIDMYDRQSQEMTVTFSVTGQ
jgi:peptidoglycan hydrolase-like protein with peptidoglycan-binding domain